MHLTEPKPAAPFFVVLNAGSGHSEEDLRCSTIRDVLHAAGRRCEIEVVHDADRLPAVAAAMAGRARAEGGALVAAGGDGTLNVVAHEAVKHGCVFGVLPQGTFNYFGRTHGIPEDLTDAVHALLRARVYPVQIGLLNDRIFLVNASIGLYPKMLEQREHDKRQFGRYRLVAALSALKTILSPHRHLRIDLEVDGTTRRLKTSTLFIGNNRLQMEQVGLKPLEYAVEEGQLAALAPRPVGRWRMVGLLLRGALGQLDGADDLVSFAVRSMTVRAPRLSGRSTIKVAIDGEGMDLGLPLRFRAVEGELALLVPEPADAVAGTAPSRMQPAAT